MKKRSIAWMLIVLLLALTACGPQVTTTTGPDQTTGTQGTTAGTQDTTAASQTTASQTEATTTATTAETMDLEPTSKTIRIAWLQQYWETKDDLQYLFDGFKRLYPDYTLEINYNLAETSKLLAEIQSGNQPDLYMGADPNWATYVTGCYQRVFQPLDDYLKFDPDYNFATVPENLLKTTQFNPDGKYYAIPYALSAYCLSYNRTMFEKAGMDPDDPPKTWSEWLDANNRLILTDSKGIVQQIGIEYGHPYGYIIHPLRKHDIFADDGLSSNYNQQWVSDDETFAMKFDDKYNEKLSGDVELSFLNGNVGMNENTNIFDLGAYTTSGLDFDIALLPSPDDYPERVVPCLLWMYISIPVGAKNPNGGWLFAKYACTDGQIEAMAIRASKNPTNFTPSYIIHTPTRERAYKLYMGRVDEKTKAIIAKRDAMVEQINYIIPYPPIQNKKGIITERWNKRYVEGTITILGKNEGIHNEMTQELSAWKKDMEAQGWHFPEGEKPYFEK